MQLWELQSAVCWNTDAAALSELICLEPDRCRQMKLDDLSQEQTSRLSALPFSRLLQSGPLCFCRLPESFGLIDLKTSSVFRLPDPNQPDRIAFVLFRQKNEEGFVFQSHSHSLVYLNFRRTRQGRLQDGDWLLVNGISLRLLHHRLLVPAELGRESPDLFCSRPPEASDALLLRGSVDAEEISIEDFVLPEHQPVNPSSAAGMMVIGSLASLAGGLFGAGQSASTLLAGLLSAGVSAAALTGWHQWNRLQMRRREERRRSDQMNAYVNYLQNRIRQAQQIRQQAVSSFWKEARSLSSFDPRLRLTNRQTSAAWQLPIGGKEESGLILKIPEGSWKESRSPARKALDELSQFPCGVPVWVVLHQGERIVLKDWSENQIQTLYLLWCWMVFASFRSFVWIGFEKPESLHPASRIEDEDLYFGSYAAFLSCKTRWPGREWTVCSKEWIDESASDETRLYVCDSRTDSVWEQKASLQKIETVCSQACVIHSLQRHTERYHTVFRRSSFLPAGRSGAAVQQPEFLQSSAFSLDQCDLSAELAPGIFWDLRSEGPHALIAGATGSGKSEGLCTVLFQMALKNPASRIQFILIDFKGGAFSVPLQDLPHTSALLTNLDSRQIRRLETALQNELDRRQTILADALQRDPGRRTDIEMLIDPQSGDVFSHLIICVDEFGQLKTRCPEFLKSLQETARIGRSLGVHLILSTQKPAGLVDEQIWANSKSRLCFSVLDRADSREVLGHDGAAHLTQSGEFILQTAGQSEKKGRAFYLKAPVDGSSALQEKKNGIWQDLDCWSLQDEIRFRILQRREKRRWLLVPDPAGQAAGLSGLWVDRIRSLEPFELEPGSLTILCGRKANIREFLEALLDHWTDPAALSFCWTSMHDADLMLSLPSFWLLADQASPCLAILELNETLPVSLIEALDANSNITLILAAEEVSFHQENLLRKSALRICTGLSSRDQLSLFSEGRLRQEENWPACTLLYPDRIERLAVGQKKSESASRMSRTGRLPIRPVLLDASADELAQDCRNGLIGIEAVTQKPHFVTETGLCLVWEDEAGSQAARSLLERLLLEDPLRPITACPAPGQISWIDLRQQGDSQARLKDALRFGPLLCLGETFSFWKYGLQIQVPAGRTGNGVLIEDGRGIDLMTAGLRADDSVL